MSVVFTAHNIRLDDGTLTKPDVPCTMDQHPRFVAAKRVLETTFPGDKSRYRIADLGCLEGGYTVEFARLGFRAFGIDVRESNIAACRYVQSRTNLPQMEFAQDDVWNIARYAPFDAVFCCGLLYHLDRPRQFLQLLAGITSRLLIVQTHFSTETVNLNFKLSKLTEHEGLQGRWYTEFNDEASFQKRETSRWSSWDNRKSFWVRREHLFQAIRDAGFDMVMEQFDGMGPDIAGEMLKGEYKTHERGTFVGVKTAAASMAA